MVASGEVEIVVADKVVATAGEGEVFGEIALISDLPRTAQVRAKTAADVVSVSRDAFKTLVKHLPGVKNTMEEIMRSRGQEVDLGESLSDESSSTPPTPHVSVKQDSKATQD